MSEGNHKPEIASDQPRGRVSTEKTIWCGRCSHWDQRSSENGILKLWRKEGWKRTKRHGWVCPNCAKEKRRDERASL